MTSHPLKSSKSLKTLFKGIGVVASLVILFISFFVYQIFTAGHTTKAFKLCSSIKEITVDMSNPKHLGYYSFEVKQYFTKLALSKNNHAYGCLDLVGDSLADQCLQYGGMISPVRMTGEWRLINDAFYTDPHGIHIGPGSRMDYVGLKQGEVIVYIPLFTLENAFAPLRSIDITRGELLEDAKKIICN